MANPSMLEASSAPPEPTEDSSAVRQIHGRSPTRIALDRLRKDKIAIVCAIVVLFFVLIAVFADALTAMTGTDPHETNQELIDEFSFPTIAPNAEHPFGIEPRLGRDLFARWVHGARPSLIVGAVGAGMAGILGVTFGLLAGFLGGRVDRAISWVIDLFLSMPFLLFAIAILPVVQSWFPSGGEVVGQVRLWTLVAVFGLFMWTQLARLVRAEVLSLREREFVQAARVIGLPTRRILFRELLPNITGQVIVFLSLSVPLIISSEAGLSFLGVGLVEPVPSWGRTIASAVNYYDTYPIYFWLPAIAVLVLVLALNLLGDAIRDAFDPKTRR